MTTLDIFYHLHDLDLSLDDLVSRCGEFSAELTDPEMINEAWFQATEDVVVMECQPYSLAEFLHLIIRYSSLLISGKVVWLNMLESSLGFQATGGDLEVYHWRGISSHQVAALLGSEILPGLCYEMKFPLQAIVAQVGASVGVRIPILAWLQTSLHWGRQFAQLVQAVQGWDGGKLLQPSNESQERAIAEIQVFLATLSKSEADVSALIASQPLSPV